MEQQKGRVQAGDHEIFVVALVADEGRVIERVPRQILEQPPALDLEFGLVVGVGQFRSAVRPSGINRVEIEVGRPAIGRSNWLAGKAQSRRAVEGDVVVEKLAEEGQARCVSRAVPILEAQ